MENALNWRYATKKFDSNASVDEGKYNQIIEAGRLAPTSYGLQLLKFVDVKDADLKSKIKEVAFNQPQITDADRLLIVMHQSAYHESLVDEYLKDKASVQGMELKDLDQFGQMIKGHLGSLTQDQYENWTSKQSYIALGCMISEAAQLHIDTCPMEGFDKEAVNQILNIDSYYPAVILAVGKEQMMMFINILRNTGNRFQTWSFPNNFKA